MRLFVLLSAAVILSALALTACNSNDGSASSARSSGPATATTTTTSPAPAQATAPDDGVARITTAELRDALEKGTAIVVDVRSAESFKTGHIRGAVNIPEPEIIGRKGELPSDKKIVLYCS